MAWAHVMAGAPRGPGAFPPIGQVRVGEPEAAPSPGAQARERLAWGLAAAEAEGAEQAQKRQVRRALGLIEAGELSKELSKAVNGLNSGADAEESRFPASKPSRPSAGMRALVISACPG